MLETTDSIPKLSIFCVQSSAKVNQGSLQERGLDQAAPSITHFCITQLQARNLAIGAGVQGHTAFERAPASGVQTRCPVSQGRSAQAAILTSCALEKNRSNRERQRKSTGVPRS